MEIYGYHSTSIKVSKKIKEEGFNPVKYTYQNKNKKIKRIYRTWFTEELQRRYGKVCIKVDLTGLDVIINKDTCIICKELYIPSNRICEVFFK